MKPALSHSNILAPILTIALIHRTYAAPAPLPVGTTGAMDNMGGAVAHAQSGLPMGNLLGRTMDSISGYTNNKLGLAAEFIGANRPTFRRSVPGITIGEPTPKRVTGASPATPSNLGKAPLVTSLETLIAVPPKPLSGANLYYRRIKGEPIPLNEATMYMNGKYLSDIKLKSRFIVSRMPEGYIQLTPPTRSQVPVIIDPTGFPVMNGKWYQGMLDQSDLDLQYAKVAGLEDPRYASVEYSVDPALEVRKVTEKNGHVFYHRTKGAASDAKMTFAPGTGSMYYTFQDKSQTEVMANGDRIFRDVNPERDYVVGFTARGDIIAREDKKLAVFTIKGGGYYPYRP